MFEYVELRRTVTDLRKTVEAKQVALDRTLAEHTQAADKLKKSLRDKDNEARHWRQLYEKLQSSPQIQADTEAAFERGADHQREQFRAWLMRLPLEIPPAKR